MEKKEMKGASVQRQQSVMSLAHCSRLWRKAPDKQGCLWRNAEYIQHGTSNPIASVIGLIDLSFKKSRIIALWPKNIFNINKVSWLLDNNKIPNEGISFKEVKVLSE